MIRESAVEETANSLEFLYRYIWNIPAHDSRLENMSENEFQLEIEAYLKVKTTIENRKADTGPSQEFLETAQNWIIQQKAEAGVDMVPTTAEELGWTKRGS